MKRKTLCLLLVLCLLSALAPAVLADDAAQNSDYVAYYLTKYTMQSGDTMGAICTARGISFDTYQAIIKNVNAIASFNALYAGRTYWLPSTVPSATGEYYAVYKHILVSGDTVFNLCNSYGISFADNADLIMQLNDTTNLTGFYAGTPILIPVYRATAAAETTAATGTTATVDPATLAPVSGTAVVGAEDGAVLPGTTTTSTSVTNDDGSVTTTTVTTTVTTSEASNLFDAAMSERYYLIPYTVKSGDTLIAVCNSFKTSFSKNAGLISTVNGLSSASYIMVGQTLWIPCETTAGLASGYYVVTIHPMAMGETVYNICTANGGNFAASYKMLTLLNEGVNFNSLMVGQKLAIPMYMG